MLNFDTMINLDDFFLINAVFGFWLRHCPHYLPLFKPGTGDIEMPPIRLSVTFSFCPATRKRIAVFSQKISGMCSLCTMS